MGTRLHYRLFLTTLRRGLVEEPFLSVSSVTKGLDTVTGKLVAVAVSAIISAIIVGGKAALKNLSITKSTELVIMFSKVLSELLPEKRKKNRNENPRKK